MWCVCLGGLMISSAAAQQGQASALGGTVTDASGAPLANVSLTVVSPSLTTQNSNIDCACLTMQSLFEF
jgi:hypothetical protein